MAGWAVNVAIASKVIGDGRITLQGPGAGIGPPSRWTRASPSVTVVSAIEGGKRSATVNRRAIDMALAKVASLSDAHALASMQKAHRACWKQYWPEAQRRSASAQNLNWVEAPSNAT